MWKPASTQSSECAIERLYATVEKARHGVLLPPINRSIGYTRDKSNLTRRQEKTNTRYIRAHILFRRTIRSCQATKSEIRFTCLGQGSSSILTEPASNAFTSCSQAGTTHRFSASAAAGCGCDLKVIGAHGRSNEIGYRTDFGTTILTEFRSFSRLSSALRTNGHRFFNNYAARLFL